MLGWAGGILRGRDLALELGSRGDVPGGDGRANKDHRSSVASYESVSAIAALREVMPSTAASRVGEHRVAGWLLEALPGEPAAVLGRPGLRLRRDHAVTQEHLRDAVTGAHQLLAADIVSQQASTGTSTKSALATA